MAGMNPQIKAAANMAGIRVPPVKKPMVPKPDQLKKQAKAQAKQRAKKWIRLAVMAAIVAVIGLVVYFVKFYGRQPKDAFETALEYAYKDKVLEFQDMFTSDSIALVDNVGGDSTKAWEHLIDGITPSERPKVESQEIFENKDIKSAELTVSVDGEKRKIYMRQEEGAWKINLNVAINPRKLTLPKDIPPEYVENFEVSDEPEAWWEEDEKKQSEETQSSGFLAKLQFWKRFKF